MRRLLSATPSCEWRRRRILFSVTILAVAFAATAGGQNWVRAAGIPEEYVNAIASHGGLLFAATDDGGITWDIRAHEFAELLALHVSGGTLWAGRTQR